MKNELIMAINNICVERELEPQVVFEAIEAALVSAHRRRFGSPANVRARVDPKTGEMKIFIEKEVVAEVEDERTQISLAKARAIDTTADIGGVVLVESTPDNFGRIAAQTAKQVILQRIREAERDAVYLRYQSRVGEIVHCTIRSIDHSTGAVTVALDGKAEGVLAKEDQIPTERYRPNNKLRCYLVEVTKGPRGAGIRLSRTHRALLRRLLEQEVPEIYNGSVEIKSIAREPGQRSKVAVAAIQPGVDPVGSCVGMRGVRIQAIVNELNGEKIDVVEWSPDPAIFIANALSPAKVSQVILDDTTDNKTAIVVVPDKQQSLAIGKEGQNARLSAKLTGWRIDIKSETEALEENLDEYAREVSARRTRLAMARARADSGDILSVAEQLLRDDALAAPSELAEFEEYTDEIETLAEEPTSEEALAALSETTAEEALAAHPEATAEAEAAYEEYGEYDEYAEYGEYGEVAEAGKVEQPDVEGEYDMYAAGEYDEYAVDEYGAYEEYDEYDEYAEYDEYDDAGEIEEPSKPAKAAAPSQEVRPPQSGRYQPSRPQKGKKQGDRGKTKDKKRTLIYDESLGQMVSVRRRKRDRSSWYSDDE